jgi:hypothetical protein
MLGSEPNERGGAGDNTALVSSELHAKFSLAGLPGDTCRLHSQSQGLRFIVVMDVQA